MSTHRDQIVLHFHLTSTEHRHSNFASFSFFVFGRPSQVPKRKYVVDCGVGWVLYVVPKTETARLKDGRCARWTVTACPLGWAGQGRAGQFFTLSLRRASTEEPSSSLYYTRIHCISGHLTRCCDTRKEESIVIYLFSYNLKYLRNSGHHLKLSTTAY